MHCRNAIRRHCDRRLVAVCRRDIHSENDTGAIRIRTALVCCSIQIAIWSHREWTFRVITIGAAENPEKLYREKWLMLSVTICTLAMIVLLFVNLPSLQNIFAPTAPTQSHLGSGQ